MKRYLLFAGSIYYPAGGWTDYVDAFDSIREAKAAVPIDIDEAYTRENGWWHVVDIETGKKVKAIRGGRDAMPDD